MVDVVGFDLMVVVVESELVMIVFGGYVLVLMGFVIVLLWGYEVQVWLCFGFVVKYGVIVLNFLGMIDVDYWGEIKVILINYGLVLFVIGCGEWIVQMVIVFVVQVMLVFVVSLLESDCGVGGFGLMGC